MAAHDEATVVRKLTRHGAKVNTGSKKITPANKTGLALWGMIDYLRNYCGYKLMYGTFTGGHNERRVQRKKSH